MARFLFVVPPFFGHVAPTVAVGEELMRRGHEVAWVGFLSHIRDRLLSGLPVICLDPPDIAAVRADMQSRFDSTVGMATFKFFIEEILVPLAQHMLPPLEQTVEAFRPDVLVVDHQAYAGAVVARSQHIKWATLATSSVSVVFPLATHLPKVNRWMTDRLSGLMQEAAIESREQFEFSPHLVLIFSTEALVGPHPPLPDTHHFVGPSIRKDEARVAFPWEKLQEGRRVLVSVGTVNFEVGARFFRASLEALADQPFQVVLVARDDMIDRPIPSNFLVQSFIPQLAVLPKMDAVVCHAGHNTVAEALAFGLPLVLAPINTDQPAVAHQVVQAGAGIQVKFRRIRPVDLRDAVLGVLNESRFREAAHRIQASFAQSVGAIGAAGLLEGLV